MVCLLSVFLAISFENSMWCLCNQERNNKCFLFLRLTLDQLTVSHCLLLHHREACGFTDIWFLLSLCFPFCLPFYPDVNDDKGHRQPWSGEESLSLSESRTHGLWVWILVELGPFGGCAILRYLLFLGWVRGISWDLERWSIEPEETRRFFFWD